MSGAARRVGALVLRYVYLYRRSIARTGEIVFWPVMDLLVWGFLTTYLTGVAVPDAVAFLLGGVILWDVLYRAQQGITISFTEEIWARNLLNIFIAPVRAVEIVLATVCVGVLKAGANVLVLTTLSFLFWRFDLLRLGPALAPFVFSLLLFAWAVGMCTAALILRFGQAAEALVWGVPFLIQPLAAVFYPVETLPTWLQPIARLLPATHVFEGMRAVLKTGRVETGTLLWAFGLNLVYLAAAGAFFAWMLARVREKGYLCRLGME